MEDRGHTRAHAPQRLDWVDVARGMGILAVVAGHVWTRGALHDAAYSFHMPFFFLLSGMLSRPHPAGIFTRRLFFGQMRPYAAFLILLVVADQIIEPMRGGRPIFHQWPRDLLPILLGGSWLRGPYTIFWFVPCLMVARMVFNLALERWPDPLDRRWALLLIPLALLAYALGWMTDMSPLGLLAVPMALLLLWAGAVWPRIPWHNGLLLPLGALALGGLAGLFPALNMKAADYGWPLLSVGAAVATSVLLFRFSARVAPWTGALAAIGRASLVIMYLHVAVIHYLSPYMGKPWLLAAATLLPLGVWRILCVTPPLRRIFL